MNRSRVSRFSIQLVLVGVVMLLSVDIKAVFANPRSLPRKPGLPRAMLQTEKKPSFNTVAFRATDFRVKADPGLA